MSDRRKYPEAPEALRFAQQQAVMLLPSVEALVGTRRENNAIQLKGLYKETVEGARRYGSHMGTPVYGFPFDPIDLEFCPYKIKSSARGYTNRRKPGPVSRELVDRAVSEFDRIILILRDDFGIPSPMLSH